MPHSKLKLFIALAAALPLFAFAKVPQQPSEVNPIEVGSHIPNVKITAADGSGVRLHNLVGEQKTVIVFYRGSWCPYCTRHLAALGEVEGALLEQGYQIIAISPDRETYIRRLQTNSEFNFSLYSDSRLRAASAFGLTFKLDEPTLEQLASYEIDIEAASGRRHHLLPVPAVYIVDTDGEIQFRYYNPDYSKRLDPNAILQFIEKDQ